MSSTIQVLPLLLTLSAFVFLTERTGVRRVGAVVMGFVCVLMIIRLGISDSNLCKTISLFGVPGISMLEIGLQLNRKFISTILLSFYSSLLVTLSKLGMLYGTDGLQWSDRWT